MNDNIENPIIPTGIDFLDDALGGGLSKNSLNLIGSHSGVGKTLFSMTICKNIYLQKNNVLHISYDENHSFIFNKYFEGGIKQNNYYSLDIVNIHDYNLDEIINIINNSNINYDFVFIDVPFLSNNNDQKLFFNKLLKSNKTILLTTQLVNNNTSYYKVKNIELLYVVNTFITLESINKKYGLLNLNIVKSRYYKPNTIKNVVLEYENLNIKKVNIFELIIIKIKHYIYQFKFEEKIEDIYTDIVHPFKKFYWNIKNLIIWFPIIWNNRYWDYYYLIRIMRFQMLKMADFFESDNTVSRDIENNAKRIRTVIKLMDKVYEEDYAFEYLDQIEDLYGKRKFESYPVENNPQLKKLSIEYTNDYSNEELKRIDKHEKELFLKSHEKQEKAHRILWKMIEQNIRKWWD